MSNTGLPKILIADDSPTIVDIMKFMLEASGYDVVTATNGMEAIITAFKEDPDLILLDVEMPKMNGYQVCRYLKEDRYFKQTPIVILTSHAHKKMRFLGVYTGADEYLIKDEDQEQLLGRIEYYVKRRRTSTTALKGTRPTNITEISVMETINGILDRKLVESTIINQVGRLASNLDRFDLVVNSIFGLVEKMEEFDFSAILVRELGGAQLFIQTQRSMPPELMQKFQSRVIQSALQFEVIMDESKVQTKLIPRTEKGEFQVGAKAKNIKIDNLKYQDNILRSRQEPIGILAIGNFSDDPIHNDIVETVTTLSNHVATLLDNWLIWKRFNDVNQTLNTRLFELNVEILHELQFLSGLLTKNYNLEELTQVLCKQIPKIIRADKIGILIKRKVGNDTKVQSFGKWEGQSHLTFDIINEWLTSEQLNKITNQSIINDLSKIKFFKDHGLDKSICKNMLIVPLFISDDKIGLITLFDRLESDGFNQQDLEILRFVSGLAALSLKSVLHQDNTSLETIHTNTYKRFLSDEAATSLLLDSSLLDMDGMEKEATILLVDLLHVEELSEQLDPKVLIKILNSFVERMTNSVFAHLGSLEKYREVGLKCVFGIPMSNKDDTDRAVLCAIQMRQEFNALKDEYPEFSLGNLGLRIIIHTGNLIFGNIGIEYRNDFVAFGKEVNFVKEVMREEDTPVTLLTENTIMKLEGHYNLLPLDKKEYRTQREIHEIYQLSE